MSTWNPRRLDAECLFFWKRLIVLSHGSGPANAAVNARFARPLVQRGFAVFRFDKRGVGKSEGKHSRAFAFMTVLAGDLVAAVDFVKNDSRIDRTRIGLMGQSQAGWVIPEAAIRSDDVAFVILHSGPTVTGQQANYWDQIADDQTLSIDQLETVFQQFQPSGWDLDPRPHLEQMTIPGLWIYGEEDRIVPGRLSAEILRAIAEDLDKPFTTALFPGVGHSLGTNYWPTLFAWYDHEVGP
ncbi:MAG: alpha/beta fold hydrolase [Candidatus Latescibacteria bacterium]|nr:alpha/beta fold hydrolase [Candidatus Latescibacterota bacterium]